MLRMVSEQTLDMDEELCAYFRLAEGIWPCKLDQINADPKGAWYWMAWKMTDQQIVHGSEC